MYKLYGCRFTRMLIVQMVLAEGEIEYELREVDIILCFWAEYMNIDQALAPYPALRTCMELVTNRPLLRPFFDELIESRNEYAQMQAEGGGVK
jgi:hypothetical protein